jgi:hypothetical protein
VSDIQTWEWPPEMAASLAELHKIMTPNPHPNRKIEFSDLVVDDVVQPE